MAQLQPDKAAEAQKYDLVHNGMLDENELTMWRDVLKIGDKPTSVELLLSLFDKDGDQKLEKNEIVMMAKFAPEKAAEAKKYDLDHNGMLDVAELQQWKDVLKAEADITASEKASAKGGN